MSMGHDLISRTSCQARGDMSSTFGVDLASRFGSSNRVSDTGTQSRSNSLVHGGLRP